jgi:hypothetical protein
VANTRADRDVGGLAVGQTITVVAIGRMDLRKLLAVERYSGVIPVEFYVFGINRPNLPEPERRRRNG